MRWRELLARDVIAREELERIVEAALAEALPYRNLDDWHVSLGNLERVLANEEAVEDRVRAVEQFVRGVVESVCADDALSLEHVVPLVKCTDQLSDTFVSRPFVADLHVVYAIDRMHSFAMLSKSGQARLGVSMAELDRAALTNLGRLMPDLDSEEQAEGFTVVSGNYLAASMLLARPTWRELAKQVEGQLVACAPARHVVLFAGDAIAGAVDRMRAFAERIIETVEYPLSKRLLRWSAEGWHEV